MDEHLLSVWTRKKLSKNDQAAYSRRAAKGDLFRRLSNPRLFRINPWLRTFLGFAQNGGRGHQQQYRFRNRRHGWKSKKTMNAKLSGVPGWRLTETDRRGRELGFVARPGFGSVRWIECGAHRRFRGSEYYGVGAGRCDGEAYRRLAFRESRSGRRRGEILAMATLPQFQSKQSGCGISGRAAESYRDGCGRNRASTFKIVVISGALNDHPRFR